MPASLDNAPAGKRSPFERALRELARTVAVAARQKTDLTESARARVTVVTHLLFEAAALEFAGKSRHALAFWEIAFEALSKLSAKHGLGVAGPALDVWDLAPKEDT